MNRSRWITAVILIGVGVILTACANPAQTPEPATAIVEAAAGVQELESAVELAQTAWELESFGDADEMIPVIPDTYPSVHFMAERYSGYNGCDWFLGVYRVDGNTVRMEMPAATQYGCGEDQTDLIDQAATYTDGLENITVYELADGKLLLYTAEDQLLLTMAPLESLPFEGTTWNLKFLASEGAFWQPLAADTAITATFDGERMTGNAGCNEYAATFTRDENQFYLDELTVTEKSCSEPEGVMDQEEDYLSMLADAGILVESARTIELFTADETPLLLYHGE